MLEAPSPVSRVEFFEQFHHECLAIKGYGTYAYIDCRDVDQLYDTYLRQQQFMVRPLAPQVTEVSFIRSFIKSL